jgi:hypothetical protein
MLEKLISGGRTGAEQAAWRAAKAFSLATGGWMPSGFLTEDGPRPEFAKRYSAADLPIAGDLTCTEHNVRHSDATLWFGETTTFGAQEAVASCHTLSKPCMLVYPEALFEPSHVAMWIEQNDITTLHATGNLEEEVAGIGDHVEAFLSEVLQLLGHERT